MRSQFNRWTAVAAWLLAFGFVGTALWVGLARLRGMTTESSQVGSVEILRQETIPAGDNTPASGPGMLAAAKPADAVVRRADLHTIIPNRPGTEVREYLVAGGDSVFEIAARFNIRPETLLWSNYDQLNDNPHMISVGMELNIPPVDGVYYEWQENDSLESVAARFKTDSQAILSWPGNGLDLTDPRIEPGTLVMIPGGEREFRQWLIPTIPRGAAGVSAAIYGAGACTGSYEGAFGSGAFVWPAGNHYLSGNDYWSGHLAIDIGAGEGAPIYAADNGVVVFSGWANGGYGYMVMIDHGNGYQTLYGHLSQVAVSCGRSIAQGQTIGYGGSTGNSTGPHLHFEVRYQGGFVNPWYVLPAP